MDVSYKSNRSNSEIQVYARYLSSFQRIEIEIGCSSDRRILEKKFFFFFFFNAPFPQSLLSPPIFLFFYLGSIDRSWTRSAFKLPSCSHNSSWDCFARGSRNRLRGFFHVKLYLGVETRYAVFARRLRGLLIRKVAEQDRVETRGDMHTASYARVSIKGKQAAERKIYIYIFRRLDLRTVNT